MPYVKYEPLNLNLLTLKTLTISINTSEKSKRFLKAGPSVRETIRLTSYVSYMNMTGEKRENARR